MQYRKNLKLQVLTAAGEVHGVDDGVIPVHGERHQDIGGRVRHYSLEQHNTQYHLV